MGFSTSVLVHTLLSKMDWLSPRIITCSYSSSQSLYSPSFLGVCHHDCLLPDQPRVFFYPWWLSSPLHTFPWPTSSLSPPMGFWLHLFAHILSPGQDKLSTRATKCAFLGYSLLRCGYDCYSLDTQCYFISINVTFFDDTPVYPISTTPEPPILSIPLCYFLFIPLCYLFLDFLIPTTIPSPSTGLYSSFTS